MTRYLNDNYGIKSRVDDLKVVLDKNSMVPHETDLQKYTPRTKLEENRNRQREREIIESAKSL